MKKIKWIIATLSLFLVPGIAMAGPSTAGDAIQNFDQDIFTNVPTAMGDFFFLCGVVLVCMGLYHLASGFNQNSQTKKSHGGWMLLCGIVMSSLPLLLGIDVETMLGVSAFTGGNSASVGATTSCLSGSAGSDEMACVLRNLAVNVVPIAVHTVFVGCYLVAAIIACSIILKLAESRRNGVNEPDFWKAKLAVCGILLNVPIFLSEFGSTFGYGSLIDGSGYEGMDGDSPSSLLTYVPPGDASGLQHYAGAIQWAFVILSMFGIFYAIYGIVLLMKFEDRQHTKASAWVHIIAGILLANIGQTVQYIWPTLFGGGS